MDSSFIQKIYQKHKGCTKCPSTVLVPQFFTDLLGILFPNFASSPVLDFMEFQKRIQMINMEMVQILSRNPSEEESDPMKQSEGFFASLPEVYEKLQLDIDAMFAGDPAAKSKEEVIRSYPGFYAIAAYRIAHSLSKLGVSNIPRMITEHAHGKTGIDINPNANIGDYFCIDHGTGVVIGETTDIGKHVKVYQGVTLGALSVNKEDAKVKRHPTIEDNVVIYAGATILGGNTTIGKNSIVGGNVWLTKSIPPNSKIYYQAQMHNESEKPDLIIFK
ncbi:MAG: serine acetyltransferase [Cyclobacteriaceae bacterium]|nr:serine acetyltransferase [Cyclobacteriaceae bacterium]MCK5279228.1 serine acetyltransferase [Cyclobacteriaceae bacterium]MCK5370753.1 serine acetyltransferase [Cyclobacteriaceae bacterium]MCK5466995.1 serine acetyltransferase [Cyclobacteriaceae bacterium]